MRRRAVVHVIDPLPFPVDPFKSTRRVVSLRLLLECGHEANRSVKRLAAGPIAPRWVLCELCTRPSHR